MKIQNPIANIAPMLNAPRLRAIEVITSRLTNADEMEVVSFLAQRPVYTVTMLGFIKDNGLVSPLNRGTFYGCRNNEGQLEGVALIGHATLMETTTERALEAFAEIAQKSANTHLIMGETERIHDFWNYYSQSGQSMRLACRELLFELQWPVEGNAHVPGLRLATLADLELVMPVQAQMAFEESGINPLEKDQEGFRQRCCRRIQKGRTWVLINDEKLIFKAEVVSDTSDVVYLEGIWVNPEARRKGTGRDCMAQLAKSLLAHANSLCLLVNDQNSEAQLFYKRAGYRLRSIYDTIFLN
jgi:predicted GNAT family acetyltransferase